MGTIRARLLILKLSLKWIFRQNLGNYIWYRGEKCMILNGVVFGCWDLKSPSGERIKNAKREDCRLVLNPSNFIHSFRSGHRFYMNSWYSIWKREGIKDWMLGCRIWADKND